MDVVAQQRPTDAEYAQSAIQTCNRTLFDSAISDLQTLAEMASNAAVDIAFADPFNRGFGVLGDQALALANSINETITTLEELWNIKCKPPSNVTPGADVRKNEIQIVDTNTQEQVPTTVVTIPNDPNQPIPPPLTIGGPPPTQTPQTPGTPPDRPGTPPPPDQPFTPGREDTVVIIPDCHQKVVLRGKDLEGDTGFIISGLPKALFLTFTGIDCKSIKDQMVNSALQAAYGVQFPHNEDPSNYWNVDDDLPGICIVKVVRYERMAGVCPVTNIPDRPQTPAPPDTPGTPPPPGEGDIPQTPQGPAPTEPYAKSSGSWGQSYPDQWWLHAINWLKADGTTALPDKGVPVTVAVIDTGVDLAHPDLLGRAWVNVRKDTAKDAATSERERYRGDVFGWNFVDDNSNIRDYHGHGTVIAGIIAAGIGKRYGIAGINPWARIMALKAVELNGKGGSVNVTRAIVYAVDHGARVINISLGGDQLSKGEQAALDYAYSKGVIVVVASGNQGKSIENYTPAGLRHALTVAAVGPDLKREAFSNWGAGVALAAPGVDILSLRARQTDLLMFERKNYKPGTAVVGEKYYRVTGSSFAAPMVAGAASLILSARPNLTGPQVIRLLEQTAHEVGGIGMDQFTGYGLIDVDAALKADPNVFVEAGIKGVAVTNVKGRTVVRVSGTANADRLKEAYIEIGVGDQPSGWKRAARVAGSVENGSLADLDPKLFAGSKVWTLRVIAVHQNNKRRESRFKLTLG
jgi:subtilisin family serine protease